MKTLLMLLISFLSLSLAAQNIEITFAATNPNKNYQVVIDGASYYSANGINDNGRKVINIPNLTAGSHTLEVYSMGNNNNIYTNGSTNSPIEGEEVYSKTFQLRQGYDMDIAVRPNGLVSFTEKRAEVQNTSTSGLAMSTANFNRLLQSIRIKRYQSEKITMIKKAFTTTANKFTSSQVRQLLLLITAESRRLELAKLSYKKVTDTDEFTTVYDVLKSEAGRDSLDDYVVSQGGNSTDEDDNAAYDRRNNMSATNFNQLLQRVQNQSYQSGRVTEIRNALNSSYNYFSTAQLNQMLLLVSSETDRLTLAKLAYPRTTDVTNFNQLVDLFNTQYNRDELNRFIVSNGGVANNNNNTNNNTNNNNTNNTYRIPMTDASFNQIYTKARSHFFQRNTVNDIRTAFVSTSNNFTTEQVKQLLMLSTAEADRLALAKLAYPRVVDVTNFSLLLDLFAMQSNRTELDNFIKAQK